MNVSEWNQTFIKKVLFINLKIQTKKQAQTNAVIMNEWNLINTSDFDHNHEINKVSKQMKNKSCKNNVNKKHECEKIKEHECEHEKNKKQK